MSNELQRIHDKINYETNVVDPKTFAILLKAVERNQPLSYEKGRDEIFPNARSDAGMQWDPTKPDTHASGTLEQYCLVNATEDRTITVSDLGYRFLSCFDDAYDIKVQENYYKTVLLEMIFSWVVLEHGRNIHPGRMLFKLMLDSDLDGYHTSNEFALWTSDECAMTDSDYANIKQLILDYRENPVEVKQKKAEVFLRPFANSWGLFDRTINNGVYTFRIRENVLPLVKQFFIFVNIEDYTETDNSGNIDEIPRLTGGTNILLYGVPGSGKSYKIETDYCKDFDLMERVVFHPDYMNTDFVGQILPTVRGEGDEKEITYDFTPGPFTRVLKKAIKNPNKHFHLVIEEINRGNAPAIFGEIFQLLDRELDGTSSYKITNYNIANVVFGKKETPIFIPSNLSVLATMNTADQNVFTLDTAFQRRWNMKMIENDVTKAKHAEKYILDTSVTWGKFNTVVNEQIITSGATTLSSEDKRLGAYFVTEDVLKYYSMEENKSELAERYDIEIDETAKLERKIEDLNSRFGDKVIKYLWDDAFKFSRDDLFESSYKSLEKVLEDFGRYEGDRKFDIFNQDIKDNLFEKEESEGGKDE